MSTAKEYTHFTALEVAEVLAILNCEDMTGETIARGMMNGEVEFEPRELEKLAAYKGVTVEYMTENDPAFRRYANPVTEIRNAIAAGLLKNDMDVELAAEICGIPVEKVRRIKKSASEKNLQSD